MAVFSAQISVWFIVCDRPRARETLLIYVQCVFYRFKYRSLLLLSWLSLCAMDMWEESCVFFDDRWVICSMRSHSELTWCFLVPLNIYRVVHQINSYSVLWDEVLNSSKKMDSLPLSNRAVWMNKMCILVLYAYVYLYVCVCIRFDAAHSIFSRTS